MDQFLHYGFFFFLNKCVISYKVCIIKEEVGVDIIACHVMVDHIIGVKWQSEKVLEITVK